jgi:hypothetical protein
MKPKLRLYIVPLTISTLSVDDTSKFTNSRGLKLTLHQTHSMSQTTVNGYSEPNDAMRMTTSLVCSSSTYEATINGMDYSCIQ